MLLGLAADGGQKRYSLQFSDDALCLDGHAVVKTGTMAMGPESMNGPAIGAAIPFQWQLEAKTMKTAKDKTMSPQAS